MISKKFPNYELANRAIYIAKYIMPGSYWYLTNESGQWEVKEGPRL